MFDLRKFAWIGLAVLVLGNTYAQSLELGSAKLADLGEHVVVSDGTSVYATLEDAPNVVGCLDSCAAYWPIVESEGAATAIDGADESLIGEIERPDGTLQVTYGGWPLYYFSYDPGPGATRGQGNAGVWFLVSTAGDLLGHEPVSGGSESDVAPEEVEVTDAFTELMNQGEQVYARVCVDCHGTNGEGGVGVRLADNSRLADAHAIADAVTNGLAYMPALGSRMTAEETAAALTFIRNSWGNNFGEVSVETAEEVRE